MKVAVKRADGATMEATGTEAEVAAAIKAFMVERAAEPTVPPGSAPGWVPAAQPMGPSMDGRPWWHHDSITVGDIICDTASTRPDSLLGIMTRRAERAQARRYQTAGTCGCEDCIAKAAPL